MGTIRRTILLLALAVLLGSCAEPIGGPLTTRPPADAPASLRVMTFNIRYGTADDGPDAWPRRRQQVFDVIRRRDPDVVGLQEALRFQLDEIAEAVPGYVEIGVGRDNGQDAGEHAAILVRASRFAIDDVGHFWLSGTPDQPGSRTWGNEITRLCTWTRLLDRHRGRELYVFNTHLDHESQPSRGRSVELLRRRIRDRAFFDPCLLLGDFNAAEDSPEIGALLATDTGDPILIDSFRAVHRDAADTGTFGGFTGRRDGPKIDYIFMTPDFEVRDADILHDNRGGRYPSDHYPVVAELRLGNGER